MTDKQKQQINPDLYEKVKNARQDKYRRDESMTTEEYEIAQIQERLKARKLTKLVRQLHDDMDMYE